ncbi:uncharacterized protein [Mytilus edulis]|uniref:uncharacterized protein n=1 Tax=Mytilus edulis TaxID=6550 RepID=UPI0039EFEC7D
MYPPTFQFRKPPDTSPKDYPFNLDIFTKSTGYNILTKAIRTQFDKCGVIDTAWEYFTLARSYDPYQALKRKPAKPLFESSLRFFLSDMVLQHVTIYPINSNVWTSFETGIWSRKNRKNTNLQKEKEGRTDTSESQSEGAVPQSQTPTEVGFITVRSNRVCSAQASTSTCVFCDNRGIFFCYDCKSAFCKPCRDTHDKPLPSKKHTVIDLNCVNPSAVKLMCEFHKSEYTFYCIKCNTLVCNTCITSDHKEHGLSGIIEKSDEIKRLAKSKLSDMKDQLQSISKLAEKTKMVNIPELDEESGDAIARIRHVSKDLQKLIETKTDIKVNEVEDETQWKKEELQSAWKNKERIHRKQTAVYESLKTLLSEEHAVSFLVSYQTLKRDMCDLTSEAKDVIEPYHIEAPDLKGFLDETIHSLQEYRKKLE